MLDFLPGSPGFLLTNDARELSAWFAGFAVGTQTGD